MAKPSNLKFMLLFFFIWMFVSCNGQTSTSIPKTQFPTNSPTAFYTPTKKPTIQPLSSPTYTSTSTSIPLITHVPSSETAIEVIVFTWDWPMRAGIPKIHIWKDNRAMWVSSPREIVPLRYEWHVYETILSDDEMSKVQETIKTSGLWEFEEPGFPIPDYSWLTIWANQSGQEKRVVVRDSKFWVTVSSLTKILEASPLKTEYFPKQGYLFTSKDESILTASGFRWPDEKFEFDFGIGKTEEGVLVDGEILSTIWESVQQGYYWITSRGSAYLYSIKIPGLTCLYNYDEAKHLWECNIYVNKLP